jgi:hypothetical protein
MRKKRARNIMIVGLLCLSLSANACQSRPVDGTSASSDEPVIIAPETTENNTGIHTTVAETPETTQPGTTEVTAPTETEALTEVETSTEPETTSIPGLEYQEVPVVRYVLSGSDSLLSDLGFDLPDIDFDAIYPITVKAPDCPETEAYLIDFTGENGYVIVNDEYSLLAVMTNGDYSALAGYSDLCYAMTDGLLYTVDGIRMCMDRASTQTPTPSDRIYVGQESIGEGEIYNLEFYVSDRYSDRYTSSASKILEFEELHRQRDLSVYKSNGGEGNCTLAAVYTCLEILGRNILYDTALFPALSETVTIDVVNDPNYPKYADDPNYHIDPYVDLPLVYSQVRDVVVGTYNYLDGVFPWVNEILFNNILDKYECGMKAVNHYAWTYQEDLIPEIDAGLPVQMSITGAKCYASHSISVIGYEYLTSTTPVGQLTKVDTLFFLTIADNWNTSPVSLDTNIQTIVGNIITFEQK